MLKINIFSVKDIHPFPPRPAKTALCFLLCQTPEILLIKGEPLGGTRLTGPICSSLFLHSLCYFTLSNARWFYSPKDSLKVGNG